VHFARSQSVRRTRHGTRSRLGEGRSGVRRLSPSAQKSGRQEQDSAQERKTGPDDHSDKSKGEGEEPDQREEQQSEDRHWPAKQCQQAHTKDQDN
jgi:hypothetical protein